MTDRLAEFRAGSCLEEFHDSLDVVDLENPEELEDENEKRLAQYRKEVNAISEAIDRINENIEMMEANYHITASANAEPEDKEYASNEIFRLLGRTERTSSAIRKRLRRIAGENMEFSREHKEKTGELRVRVNTHQALTRRFMEAMQIYEESQDRHRKSVKSALERQLRRMNPDASDDDIQEAIRRGKLHTVIDDSPTFDMMSVEEQTRLRNELADLQSRNNDIKNLEASIVELHQLFMDMQLLVETQGDLLNDIEYNIDDTKVKTEAGLHELVDARAYKKSAGKKKACIVALIVILLLLVMVPVLVKYVPIWFPKTKETIDGITSAVGGNTTASTQPPATTNVPAKRMNSFTRNISDDASELTLQLLQSVGIS